MDYAGAPQRRVGGFGGWVLCRVHSKNLIINCLLSLIPNCLLKASPFFSILFKCIFLNICRGSHPAIITNTTMEVVVPRSIVPVIYGEDGGCLKQIREVYSVI